MIAVDTNVLIYGLVTDAVIVALCREYGVDTVLSNDRDFTRFPWVKAEPLGG